MRKRNLVLIFFCSISFCLLVQDKGKAQSFSVGHAVPLWGNTAQAFQVNTSVSYITVSYIHIYMNNPVDGLGMSANRDFVGAYFTPKINREVVKFIPKDMAVTPIIGFMHKPYPNENGRHLHFGISLSWEFIDHMDLYYKHISNGYLGISNVGIDTFGIRAKL